MKCGGCARRGGTLLDFKARIVELRNLWSVCALCMRELLSVGLGVEGPMMILLPRRFACALVALATASALLAQNYGPLPKPWQAELPEPVDYAVDFARDIQPIFEASCVQCHAHGRAKGVFSLETRDDFSLRRR